MLSKKLFLLGVLISYGVSADLVTDDNLIIQGNKCIGLDCANGESFSSDTLRLKENNTRIRFHDTALENGFGQSWSLEANAFNNGGQNYFDFMVKSLTKDSVQLSDGTAPVYDCSAPFDRFDPPDLGKIPVGEPVTQIEAIPGTCSPNIFSSFCEYICSEIPDFSVASVLKMGKASQPYFVEATAIGYQSSMTEGAVSVGTETLLRRVVNIATALNNTDIVSLKTLNDYDLVASQRQLAYEISGQLDAFEAQVAELEKQLDALESADLPEKLVSGLDEHPPRLPDGSVIDTSHNGDMASNSRWVNNIRLKMFTYTLQLAIELQPGNPEIACRLLGVNQDRLSGSRSWFSEESSVTASLRDALAKISMRYQCQ